MQREKDFSESTESEMATFLSILREPTYGGLSTSGHENFSILPYFVGHLLYPPQLPRFSWRVAREDKRSIVSKLDALSELYEASYGDHELTPKEADRVKKELESIGRLVASCIQGFRRVWAYIERYNNLIIVTNEPDIPWTLACYEGFDDSVFLCNQFSCGIILAGDGHPAMDYLEKFRFRGFQPGRKDLISEKPRVVLIAAPFGDGASENDPCNRYVGKLNDFFAKSMLFENSVKCLTPNEWKQYSGKPKVLATYLSDECSESQIIHFTGHVMNGTMRFDSNTYVGASDLNKNLDLPSSPLVVLHGCSSGRVSSATRGAELYRAFLDKGASGCLATLLPVNIPSQCDDGTETVIELFYKEVLNMKPYGSALKVARDKFTRHSPNGDPQALFYVLYGDPRAKLIPRPSTREILEYVDQQERSRASVSAEALEIKLEGANIDANDLLGIVNQVDWLMNVRPQSQKAQLSFPMSPDAVHIVFHCLALGAASVAPHLLEALGKSIIDWIRRKKGTVSKQFNLKIALGALQVELTSSTVQSVGSEDNK